MPNRVNTNLTPARPPEVQPARQANGQPQQGRQAPQAEAPETNQADRVDLSAEARARVEAARPEANTPEVENAGTAVQTAGAQAGDQGAIEGATATRANQIRTEQQEARQVANRPRPEQQQGNLVDVVG